MTNQVKGNTTFEQVQELIADANVFVAANDNKSVVKTIEKLDALMKVLNREEKEEAFESMAKAENPVLAAITNPLLVLTSKTQDKETGLFSLTEKVEVIDLVEFAKINEGKTVNPIFKNGQWMYWVEGLNHALYKSACDKANIGDAQRSDALKAWKISEIAEKLNVGKLDSKRTWTTVLQEVMDAILYVPTKDKQGNEVNLYKVDGRAANTMVMTYTGGFKRPTIKNQKMGTIAMPTEKTFRQNLMHVLNVIVTNGSFSAE